jgi:hypothetical protein
MKQFLKLVTLPIFALALSVAHASTITSAVVYQNVPDPQDASDPANWASSLPSSSFTIGALGVNFMSPSSGSSIADFLNNPTFSNEVNGFDPNGAADYLELVITGTVTLNAGDNIFDILHDDGVMLYIDGFNVDDRPWPTGVYSYPFPVTAPVAGDYAFTLEYSACCGFPSQLTWDLNGSTFDAVPEPTSLTLFGSGMVGLYGLARRRLAKAS